MRQEPSPATLYGEDSEHYSSPLPSVPSFPASEPYRSVLGESTFYMLLASQIDYVNACYPWVLGGTQSTFIVSQLEISVYDLFYYISPNFVLSYKPFGFNKT
ncbi:MAG: hypothetical protein EZS28_017362 [Streblomastix strix]|uniref:Uncharacterized protein n=1 Tax=Streblomastix strix TaxID=222440 RepID=A0A5J4VXS7_9EUKA|nr:MAG: hypothetical protein EZS28_017362 [Streblomastix strix]